MGNERSYGERLLGFSNCGEHWKRGLKFDRSQSNPILDGSGDIQQKRIREEEK